VTHRFHPLPGRDFELVVYRQNWGEDRYTFVGRDAGQVTVIDIDQVSFSSSRVARGDFTI